MSQRKILQLVREERERQDLTWGPVGDRVNDKWSDILMEEVGEVSRAILELDRDNQRVELVQVAAVAVAWLEVLELDE